MADIVKWSGAGLSAGTLTTSSAGTGDTAPTAISGTAPTIVASGTRAPRISILGSPSATQSVAYWTIPAQAQGGGRFYWTSPPAPPASGTFPIILQVNSGATLLFYIDISSTRRFNLRDSAGILQQGASDSWVENTLYRIEWTVDHATGVIAARFFLGESTTHSLQLGGTSAVLGATHDRVYIGKVTAIDVGQMFVDDILVTNTATYPGRAIVQSAPVVSVGPDQQVAPGATVYLSATASDANGDTLTYAWSFAYPTSGAPTITGANTANASFTAGPAGSIYAARCTVTDGVTPVSDIANIAVTGASAAYTELVWNGTAWV